MIEDHAEVDATLDFALPGIACILAASPWPASSSIAGADENELAMIAGAALGLFLLDEDPDFRGANRSAADQLLLELLDVFAAGAGDEEESGAAAGCGRGACSLPASGMPAYSDKPERG